MGDSASPLGRARQACDPCRKKKTKCPGERPACSFCTRLNQRCSYGRTEEVHRVQKDTRHGRRNERDDSGGRVQRLEARMEQIIDAVNLLVDKQSEQDLGSRVHRFPTSSTGSPGNRLAPQPIEDGDAPLPVVKFDTLQRPHPPRSVVAQLVDIYKERLHCQPLPLFDIKDLPSQVGRFSTVLLRSFLALTVKYSDDEFFKDSKTVAVEFYMQSSRELVFAQLGDPSASVDLLQACCLLALYDVADSKKIRAWMTTGIAVRLAISTGMLTGSVSRGPSKKSDALQRCCWSLFVLDKIYNSSFQTLPAIPEEAVMPEKPASPSTPHTASEEGSEDQRMLQSPAQIDEGVTSYSLQLLSAWGHLMAYLKNIRQGQLEDAWSPNSAYQQIKSLVFRFETVLPEVHRFRKTKFHERTESERAAARDYWAAWISMQMVYHVIQCILHHPFLHLAEIHRRQRLRSPSFLQHATDQAILHSAWVIRILDLCMDHNFAVYDPFVGHLAAMTATVLFFLRFSRDGTLATKAAKDFEVCQRFVDRMADENPHLQHTNSKLRKLAQSTTQEIQPPKVETSLLWDLLDYAASSNPSESTGSSLAVELNVNTQFLSSPQANTPRPDAVFTAQEQAGLEVSMTDFQVWDDASLTFDMVDFSTLPDVPSLTMPSSWNNGHL